MTAKLVLEPSYQKQFCKYEWKGFYPSKGRKRIRVTHLCCKEKDHKGKHICGCYS